MLRILFACLLSLAPFSWVYADDSKLQHSKEDFSLDAKKGAELYLEHGCNACHGRSMITGPQLVNLFGAYVKLMDGKVIKADEKYIKKSIHYPASDIVRGFANQMPSYLEEITDEELNYLVAYINYKNMSEDGYGAPY